MNYYLVSFLVLVLPYAFFSIYYDILDRRIPNWVNLSFLYFSSLVFAFFLTQFSLIDFGVIFLGLGFGYFFYKKGYWGGADGKIFFSLTFLLFALGNVFFYLDFLLNLALLYSLVMIFLVIFRTSRESKLKVLGEIKYLQQIFTMLIIFILIRGVFERVVSEEFEYYSYFIIFIFVLLYFMYPFLKKIFRGLSYSQSIVSIIILASFFIYFSDYVLIMYFLVVLAFKLFLNFISISTTKIGHEDELYESPFSIYLFASAIFTMIGGNNIIDILLRFLI